VTWSLSRLKTFEQCHAKFNYRYNLKLVDNYKGSAATRGVDIHKGIEDSIKGVAPVPTEAGHVAECVQSLKPSGLEHHSEFNIHLDRDWKQVIAGDYWYHGIIDLYVRTSHDTADIRDWKTGKIYPDHDEQKELYALALFCCFPELQEITTYFDYLDQGKTISKVFHPHMVGPAKERWLKRVTTMEECSEFLPMPSYGCRYCGFSKAKGGPCRF
jgi:PD-(D/E)XK nuclease superfamily protein